MHIRFCFIIGLLCLMSLILITIEQNHLNLRRNITRQEYTIDQLEDQLVQLHVEMSSQLSPFANPQLPKNSPTPTPITSPIK